MQGPYTVCKDHPTKYGSPKKGSPVETDWMGKDIRVRAGRVPRQMAPTTGHSGWEIPTVPRRPAGGRTSLQMTRARRLLKGDIAAASIPFHIYGAGTVTLSWYDKGMPRVPVRLELGPGATRGPLGRGCPRGTGERCSPASCNGVAWQCVGKRLTCPGRCHSPGVTR
jgi:hypothetical protein